MRRALDGAMGTALQARGLPPSVPPEAWLADRPGEITAVHGAHLAAGAQLLLTCTFNLASRRIAGDVEELAGRAVAAARAAVGDERGDRTVELAGAVGPSGLWGPSRPAPRAAEVAALYSRAFAALASSGVDLLWMESQYSAAEARAALRCARQAGGPAAVTVVFLGTRTPPALPDGASVEDLLVELADSGAAAVGVNCVLPGTPGVAELIARVSARVRVPVVAKPSAGLPGGIVTPAAFGAWCAELRAAGASWLGGCCGATAAHVAESARVALAP